MIKRSRITKYQHVATQLRRELLSVRFHRGMAAASAHEVAAQYGVSLPTAHQALNLLVKEGFLYRIRGSGTFFNCDNCDKKLHIGIADQTVSQMLPQETNRILNMHYELAAQFFRKHDCQVNMISYSDLMTPHMLEGMDGLLISSMYLDSKSCEVIRKSGLPTVVYRYCHVDDYVFNKLSYDLRPGVHEALSYLRPTPQDIIHLITENTMSGHYERKTWLGGLAEWGLEESQVHCHEIHVAERDVSCYRMVRVHQDMFKGAIVLAGNDELGSNIINAMMLENMVAGRDYRLVGIGNRGGHGNIAVERLNMASIDMPIDLMAEEAARQLLLRIHYPCDCECSIMVPTHFVLRDSAGL